VEARDAGHVTDIPMAWRITGGRHTRGACRSPTTRRLCDGADLQRLERQREPRRRRLLARLVPPERRHVDAEDRRQPRHLKAVKELATVRRLLVPSVQVNIGKNQIISQGWPAVAAGETDG
jgi:hypothetical protein